MGEPVGRNSVTASYLVGYFLCTGKGAMCAERHKSPCRIHLRGANEPDLREQQNQTQNTTKPPPNNPNDKATETKQIRLMSALV